jgi:16S rRNA (guanine966-N2)-methyltransferase
MRIIAGEHGGRRLQVPRGLGTRPMLDRVREALFSTLGRHVVGAHVLDLFAGTGSLGLEALSRGASSVRFVERDATALVALRRNVDLLGVGDRARVHRGDALSAATWRSCDDGGVCYDVAFFDPPYPMFASPGTRRQLVATVESLFSSFLETGAALVFHIPATGVARLHLCRALESDVRLYGTTALVYVTRN